MPGNLNLFQFSMPYMAEKCMEMLYNVLGQVSDTNSSSGEMSAEEFQKMLLKRNTEGMTEKEVVKLKVGSVGRIRRMYKNLVEN